MEVALSSLEVFVYADFLEKGVNTSLFAAIIKKLATYPSLVASTVNINYNKNIYNYQKLKLSMNTKFIYVIY